MNKLWSLLGALIESYLGRLGFLLYAFPAVSDIVATTIESRTRQIADNVMNNNAGLAYIKDKGNVKTISGGSEIFEELSFAENANGGFYSGYDLLPVAAQDVISAARFALKQAAVPVTVSGLEQLQNAGREALIDLLDGRIGVAEATMANICSFGFYNDGTAAGGKAITGLNAAVPAGAATGRVNVGTYGGIDRVTWAFWRPYYSKPAAAITNLTIQGEMNNVWAQLVRGQDRPNLILADNVMWSLYMASLQAQQRFTDPNKAKLGFPTIQYMDADVVLDGGIYFASSAWGTGAPAKTMLFLNTKFLKWRPHAQRDMVPLSPSKRYAINQDAEVSILAWAGNLTSSGDYFQGRLESL
jgi:hypothetical protein